MTGRRSDQHWHASRWQRWPVTEACPATLGARHARRRDSRTRPATASAHPGDSVPREPHSSSWRQWHGRERSAGAAGARVRAAGNSAKRPRHGASRRSAPRGRRPRRSTPASAATGLSRLGVGGDLGGQVRRERLVPQVGPRERARAVRYRTQVDGVPGDLEFRDLRLDQGPADADRLGAEHPAAARRTGRTSPRRRSRPAPARTPRRPARAASACALSTASCSASRPAFWKAMSEESTECALPSYRVTRTSIIG